MPLESWLATAEEGAFDVRLVSALRMLARAEQSEKVRAAFDAWKARARRELSPAGLTKIVGVVGALGVGELAEEAADTIFLVLRRQELGQLEAASLENHLGNRPGEIPSIYTDTLALVRQAHQALANFDRTVVVSRLATELEQGSSFSRSFALDWFPHLHQWQGELSRRTPSSPAGTPGTEPPDLGPVVALARGLLAASTDEEPRVARLALCLLGRVTDTLPAAKERLDKAMNDPLLRGAAAWGLFHTTQPATADRAGLAVELARSDDPRQATIGAMGLLSIGREGVLVELLNDANWSETRPADGPWPRLEVFRNLDLLEWPVANAALGQVEPEAAIHGNHELQTAFDEAVARLERARVQRGQPMYSGSGGGFF
jgi:hypothetical protein